jgi:hypothetical protein
LYYSTAFYNSARDNRWDRVGEYKLPGCTICEGYTRKDLLYDTQKWLAAADHYDGWLENYSIKK